MADVKIYEKFYKKPKSLFKLGDIVQTAGVDRMAREDIQFQIFVNMSLRRYYKGDWGDTCGEDALENDRAVKNGERILAVYIFDRQEADHYNIHVCDEEWQFKKTCDKDPNGIKIWIITEWDRSVTTILFPSEY